jgi:hypothetical protein
MMKLKGVFSAVILAAGLCLSGNVFAVLSGSGTEANPYLIQSRADFDEFANPANAATYWASGKYTKLMCDPNLAGTTYTQAVIAPDTSTPFAGIFDGNGHTISNLTITASTQDYVGLFGHVGSGGQIHNLGVENVNLTGRQFIGGLVGSNVYGTLTSCYADGSVSGGYSVGGLVGENQGSITTCYAIGSVTETGQYSYSAGGLVGRNYNMITSCYSTSSVSGDWSIGGLIGWNNSDAITACFWDINTSGTSNGVGNMGPDPNDVIGKTTVEMQIQSTFTDAGWDFENIWKMPANSYPLLLWQGIPTTVNVPNLIGLTQADAEAAITSTGLVVDYIIWGYSNSITAGHIMSQRPGPGTIVDLNTAVALQISMGPSLWQSSSNMMTARDQFTGCVIGDKIYVFGGNGNPDQINLNCGEVYDIASNIWSPIAPRTNNGIEELSGVAFNGKFYVFGGYGCESGPCGDVNFNEMYDPVTNTWTTLAQKPTTTASAVPAVYDGEIFLFGGYYDNIWYATVEAYNPTVNSWQYVTEMPKLLMNPAIAVYENSAYVIGGYDPNANAMNTEVMVYDFALNTWTRNFCIAPAEAARAYSYAAPTPVIDGKACLIGGIEGTYTNSWSSDKFTLFDIAAKTWTSGPVLPEPRGGHLVVVHGETTYAIGGYANENNINRAKSSVYVFSKPVDIADLDGDGDVDNDDFVIFASHWLETASDGWTWVSGSDMPNQSGVYGAKGAASPDNIPGAREGGVSWIDGDGNLWLFGGANSGNQFNDLWKFDGTNWTWISGSDMPDQPGVYGTKGAASSGNIPGARIGSTSWIDSDGNLWLFGGGGNGAVGDGGYLGDLWKYNPVSGLWTWVSGFDAANQPGVYGTKGAASPGNVPGARVGSSSWIDSSGNLWLFGGADSNNLFNDLWKFDGTNWTWVSGSDTPNQSGVYGTRGAASPGNVPGAREGSISWIDDGGSLWLFGGVFYDASGENLFNDLWKFDGTNWTWVSGSDTPNQSGVYGTKGVADPNNVPGAREGSLSWIDGGGSLWLFGGYFYDTVSESENELNDLWKFDGTNWTWVSGSDMPNQSSVYGDRGVVASGNVPGAREGSISWVDAGGSLWLFGGYSYDANSYDENYFNDLWKFGDKINPVGDLNGDGIVNFEDFSIFSQHWLDGTTPVPSGSILWQAVKSIFPIGVRYGIQIRVTISDMKACSFKGPNMTDFSPADWVPLRGQWSCVILPLPPLTLSQLQQESRGEWQLKLTDNDNRESIYSFTISGTLQDNEFLPIPTLIEPANGASNVIAQNYTIRWNPNGAQMGADALLVDIGDIGGNVFNYFTNTIDLSATSWNPGWIEIGKAFCKVAYADYRPDMIDTPLLVSGPAINWESHMASLVSGPYHTLTVKYSLDFNNDDVIDLLDLAVMCSYWLEPAPNISDFDDNGIVNFGDFSIFAQHWLEGI